MPRTAASLRLEKRSRPNLRRLVRNAEERGCSMRLHHLVVDIKGRILAAQTRVILAVNSDLVCLTWDIGPDHPAFGQGLRDGASTPAPLTGGVRGVEMKRIPGELLETNPRLHR